MVDWKKLEDEVEFAIKKQDASCIKFEPPKTLIECKYQQKYTEDKRLMDERVLNVAILVVAIGFPLITIGLYEKKGDELFAGLVIILILAFAMNHDIKKKFRVYGEIVLDAEKRILSETSGETKQPQETTQKQERVEPIAEPKERKYPDIWEMYIAIAVFFFTIYPVARDYVEKPSTFNTVVLLAVEWLIIFAIGLQWQY